MDHKGSKSTVCSELLQSSPANHSTLKGSETNYSICIPPPWLYFILCSLICLQKNDSNDPFHGRTEKSSSQHPPPLLERSPNTAESRILEVKGKHPFMGRWPVYKCYRSLAPQEWTSFIDASNTLKGAGNTVVWLSYQIRTNPRIPKAQNWPRTVQRLQMPWIDRLLSAQRSLDRIDF